tara:strand:- start:2961 stop:3284 length:324 start_codon:yes stop_codon:yes gene_type:complete
MTDSSELEHIVSAAGIHGGLACDARGRTRSRAGRDPGVSASTALALLRLGSLTGDALGLGPLRGVESCGREHALLCTPDGDGAVIIHAGTRAPLAGLRERLRAASGN